MTLGQRIQELRKGLSLSQEELGEKKGVSRQAISKREGDQTIPELDKLIALSKLFGLTVGQLLGVENLPESPEDVSEAKLSTPPRRQQWPLLVLCVLLICSLCLNFYYHHRVLEILDPPQPPTAPINAIEYACLPHHEDRTVDLAFAIEGGGELSGWDITLDIYASELGFRGMLYEEHRPLTLKRGTAAFTLEDIPFDYGGFVIVGITYTKDELTAGQNFFSAKATGPGLPWENMAPTDVGQVTLLENPALLS